MFFLTQFLPGKQAFRFICILACLSSFSIPCPCFGWQGEVVNVVEGDLLVVADSGQQQHVRLYGIDCPAKGQPFWDKARALVNHLANRKVVEVTPLYKGAEGYVNALVRVEGVKTLLNEQIVAHGMAWVRPNECSAKLCAQWKDIEKQAQMNSIGLWAEPNPIPPWEWKKQQRLKYREHRDSREEVPSSEPGGRHDPPNLKPLPSIEP